MTLLRGALEMVHHVNGKIAMLLGAFNMFYGIFVLVFVHRCGRVNSRSMVGIAAGLLMFWAILQAILDR